MSFSPSTGGQSGGELDSVLAQMFRQYLERIDISSSGGDSPKTNRVTNIPEVTGFGGILDTAVRVAVLRHMEDNGLVGTGANGAQAGREGGAGRDPLRMLGQAQSALSSPSDFLLSQAQTLVPILVPLLTVALSPQIAETAIDLFTAPGMPLDPRVKRMIQQEVFGILDRQTQENSRIGIRNVSIQSKAGFLLNNGGGSQSLLQQVRDGTGPSVGTTVIGTQLRSEGVK